MCDYSLAGLRNRLAIDGEELIVYRFPTGSIGLTSPAELQAGHSEGRTWWSRMTAANCPLAVCVPPGARLRLHDIPKCLQRQLGVKDTEEVTFIQKDVPPGRHRDAIRFSNNQEALLQELVEGQQAVVLSFSLNEGEERKPYIEDLPGVLLRR